MHPRHRSPGNGYRSGPMGMRNTRVAPESSIRGDQGMFNYRNYSDGFGRGYPRPPPTQVAPPTPQRRSDIFAEAGRLATEYLVAKGVLPQDVFTGKWQNGSLKNLVGNFHRFRQQEGESLPHHRSKNGSDGLKSHSRDKSGSKSSGSDLDREKGRNSSLSEKARPKLDLEGKGIDSKAGNVSQSRDVKPASDVSGESQSLVNNFQNSDDVASDGKELRAETDVELLKTVDDVNEAADPKDASMNDCVAEESVIHNFNDFLSLSSFSKVPTKTRSMRGSKNDLVPITEVEIVADASQGNNCDDGPLAGPEVIFKDVTVDDSSVIETPNQVQGSKHADLDSVKQSPEAGEIDQMDTDQGKVTRSQSFQLGSFMNKHEKNEGFLGIGRCSSMIMERGEKRTSEYIDDVTATKKPREWDPATDNESMLQKNVEYSEEMQLFPGAFKICDLNTGEASQRNEIIVPDPTLLLPSITESKNEVDLSTNNRGISGTYTRCGADGKEIEVIDLDDDCLQVDNVFESSERKEDTAFMGSESFPDHVQIVNDISSVQDGYDLMMSDFLGNDIAGSGNVNSLPNDVALDNGEGMLGDDESIYMSLGEIPISMPEI